MADEPTSRELLEKVTRERADITDAQRPMAVEKRRSQDAWTARERIEFLLDEGSFRESGGLVQPDRNRDLSRDIEAPADGLVCGQGRINGREVCVLSQDFTVLGGSIGTVADRKMCHHIDCAADNGLRIGDCHPADAADSKRQHSDRENGRLGGCRTGTLHASVSRGDFEDATTGRITRTDSRCHGCSESS